jgi:hypothetical protein
MSGKKVYDIWFERRWIRAVPVTVSGFIFLLFEASSYIGLLAAVVYFVRRGQPVLGSLCFLLFMIVSPILFVVGERHTARRR